MSVFRNIYNYRELLKTSIKKDIGGKYKKSFLGILWSFVNPLLQIVVYAVVFPLIMRNNLEHYTLFLCSALIPWTFFATVVNRTSFTMIENGNIIKKVYFPREILPISVVTSEAVNFLISSILIVLFALIEGVGFSWVLVFYPLILLVQYVMLIGISLIVSSITVYIRDLQHIIGVLLQLMFYATPIVYSLDSIKVGGTASKFLKFLKLNPMSYVIDGFRRIFYYHEVPDIKALLILLALSIVLCIVGYAIFNKLQKRFAEEL